MKPEIVTYHLDGLTIRERRYTHNPVLIVTPPLAVADRIEIELQTLYRLWAFVAEFMSRKNEFVYEGVRMVLGPIID